MSTTQEPQDWELDLETSEALLRGMTLINQKHREAKRQKEENRIVLDQLRRAVKSGKSDQEVQELAIKVAGLPVLDLLADLGPFRQLIEFVQGARSGATPVPWGNEHLAGPLATLREARKSLVRYTDVLSSSLTLTANAVEEARTVVSDINQIFKAKGEN